MINDDILKEEAQKYPATILKWFISLYLPSPAAGKYKFLNIKTSDGIKLTIWGTDGQDIWDKLQHFQRLQLFL